MDKGAFPADYVAGNVLLFDSRQQIQIGQELARADDLACALEFLNEDQTVSDEASLVEGINEQIQQLNLRIEQRDGLLHDLVEKLKLLQDENELLGLMLEQTQDQVALNAASQEEMMGDLEEVSANTMLVETNLERVMEEKFALEQELAEKITALIESSMINDDLQRQLDGLHPDESEAGYGLVAGDGLVAGGGVLVAGGGEMVAGGGASAVVEPRPEPETETTNQVLTMSSGKQIHVYHEFPATDRRGPVQRLKTGGMRLVRGSALVMLVVILTLVGSVIATSQSNGISQGQALDMILQSVLGWFGLG